MPGMRVLNGLNARCGTSPIPVGTSCGPRAATVQYCQRGPQASQPASRRMWANVVRVLGKQGTGALVLSSTTRRAWLRRPQPPRLAPPLPRHFALSSSAHAPSDGRIPASSSTTFEDPARKGLFYHLVPPPTPLSNTRPVFAVSLLADAPPSPRSSTVLGWLPAETPADDRDAGLNDFVENRALPPFVPSTSHFDLTWRSCAVLGIRSSFPAASS